jgi:hypothetical protein
MNGVSRHVMPSTFLEGSCLQMLARDIMLNIALLA